MKVLRIRNWRTLLQVPGGRCVCTHQVATLFCAKWRHDRHLQSATSNQKSDCVFTWRTTLSNFIVIRFEKMRSLP